MTHNAENFYHSAASHVKGTDSSVQTTYEPRCEKTGLRGFPTRSHTNQAPQRQKMARGMKFLI